MNGVFLQFTQLQKLNSSEKASQHYNSSHLDNHVKACSEFSHMSTGYSTIPSIVSPTDLALFLRPEVHSPTPTAVCLNASLRATPTASAHVDPENYNHSQSTVATTTSSSSQFPDPYDSPSPSSSVDATPVSIHTAPVTIHVSPAPENDISNHLSVPIPGSIFKLEDMTTLVLSSNNLSEVVEMDTPSKLKNLIMLDLRGNLLEGKLPILPKI
ncbi:hypothetical protein FEM48_Zijuj02G0027700 [Ziziphus jujuba var. spinosa]|uniref:Uncharacterized protein n=1 Tax=Ziziphus jujuba var. spinosa TaxID=714518 RepID=A0A978VT60_ZIZJJ|nr:hypothetical protein FEM48_Zijuj02G0027700 [Ziziphus jujuba var. spinosa]